MNSTLISDEEKPLPEPEGLPPSEFAEFVASQIRAGFGLVPFLGSGVSAASGMMMGQTFTNYLAWVVYRCIGDNLDLPQLDLRRDGWPSEPTRDQVEMARTWIRAKFVSLCKTTGSKPYPEASPTISRLVINPAYFSGMMPSEAHLEVPHQLTYVLQRPRIPAILWADDTWMDDNSVKSLRAALGIHHATAQLFPVRPGMSTTSRSFIVETALRSLSDWRSTLHFLACLRAARPLKSATSPIPPMWLEAPDQSIIDSFNFFVTNGRRPNLAHLMLCHLASLSRVRTILTTNFDTLVEDAFAEAGDAFQVISVSVRGELPEPNSVRARNTVVKLHGGLLETRADHSLDERPSERDLQRFAEYVQGRSAENSNEQFLPSHLLVCGYSASDMRCVQMIKHTLERHPETKVLWICHSKRDSKRVREMFIENEYSPEYTISSSPNSRRPGYRPKSEQMIITTVTNRADLLFYDIFERVSLGLPKGGLNYQFTPNSPAQSDRGTAQSHSVRPNEAEALLQSERAEFVKSLEERIGTEKKACLEYVVDGNGMLPLLSDLFEKLSITSGEKIIWIELEEYHDTNAVLHDVLTIIASRIGRLQLDHARLTAPVEALKRGRFLTELLKHWKVDPRQWVIFFYARNGAGGASGWHQKFWSGDEHKKFAELMKALYEPDANISTKIGSVWGFRIVYAPYHNKVNHAGFVPVKNLCREIQVPGTKPDVEAEKRLAEWKSSGLEERLAAEEPADVKHDKANVRTLNDEHHYAPLKEVLNVLTQDWLEQLVDRKPDFLQQLRALYAATLFRRARHFTAFLSDGIFRCPFRYNVQQLDNNWERAKSVKKWLADWTKIPLPPTEDHPKGEMATLFYRKAGNFYWMYRDARHAVQLQIEMIRGIDLGKDKKYEFFGQARARLHLAIAEWYCKTYRATGHSVPHFEALYHFSECLQYAPYAKPAFLSDPKVIGIYRMGLARRALREMLKTLRMSRYKLRTWVQGSAGEGWFNDSANSGAAGPGQLLTRLRLTLRDRLHLPVGEVEDWIAQLKMEFSNHPRSDEQEHFSVRSLFVETKNAEGPKGDPPSRSKNDQANSADTILYRVDRPPAESTSEEWWNFVIQRWSPLISKELGISTKNANPVGALFELFRNQCLGLAGTTGEAPATPSAWLNEFVRSRRLGSSQMLVFAKCLHYLADSLSIHAKARSHSYDATHHDPKSEQHLVSLAWVTVCLVCRLAHELCYELPAALLEFDCEVRVSVAALYGLALGRLGRFYEAHTRLNEAQAWLRELDEARSRFIRGVIELRRAEVFVLEAARTRKLANASLSWEVDLDQFDDGGEAYVVQKLHGYIQASDHASAPVFTNADCLARQWYEIYGAGSGPLYKRFVRCHIARLDDAWKAIDSAEASLAGRSHASRWWGQLYYLRINVIAEHISYGSGQVGSDPQLWRSIAFSQHKDYIEYVRELYNAGRVASYSSSYDELGYAREALRALQVLKGPQFRHAEWSDSDFLKTLEKNLAELSYLEGNTDLLAGIYACVRRVLRDTVQELGSQVM